MDTCKKHHTNGVNTCFKHFLEMLKKRSCRWQHFLIGHSTKHLMNWFMLLFVFDCLLGSGPMGPMPLDADRNYVQTWGIGPLVTHKAKTLVTTHEVYATVQRKQNIDLLILYLPMYLTIHAACIRAHTHKYIPDAHTHIYIYTRFLDVMYLCV